MIGFVDIINVLLGLSENFFFYNFLKISHEDIDLILY